MFALLLCAGLAAPSYGQTTAVVQPSNVCSAADKIEVTSFTVTPSAPTVGQSVKIAMKIKNKCPSGTNSLNIPWILKKDAEEIGSGTITLNAGMGSTDLTAYWAAQIGTFNFWGAADPKQTISETERGNNTSPDNRITISDVIATKLINHIESKNAGALIRPVAGTFSIPCESTFNAGIPDASYGNEQVRMKIDCRNKPVGDKITFYVHSGTFRLKNGWKVKSAQIVPSPDSALTEGAGKGWKWVHQPVAGSDSPAVGIEVWADAGKGIEIFVRVNIEGPQSKSPYN